MSIINSAADKATWGAIARRIVNELQYLETQLAIARLGKITGRQARELMAADAKLGEAARAIQEASECIGRL